MRLGSLLDRFPSLVVGRYIAVVSFDSGPLFLSAKEEKKGWRRHGDVAFSPRITAPGELPSDCFDEWLVFEEPVAFDEAEAFVNTVGFTPMDFDWEERRELFWAQLSRLKPLSVVADGSRCYLVTRQPDVIEALKASI